MTVLAWPRFFPHPSFIDCVNQMIQRHQLPDYHIRRRVARASGLTASIEFPEAAECGQGFETKGKSLFQPCLEKGSLGLASVGSEGAVGPIRAVRAEERRFFHPTLRPTPEQQPVGAFQQDSQSRGVRYKGFWK